MDYTTKEVAGMLSISKSTLLRWIRDGLVPDVAKDGRQWRIWTKADVERVQGIIQRYKQQGKVNQAELRCEKVDDFGRFATRNKYAPMDPPTGD
jgi:excisionase family DNA binding protein